MSDYLEIKKIPFRQPAVNLLEIFRREPYVFLLESSLRNPALGRFSFLGFDPFLTIKRRDASSLSDLRRAAGPFMRPPTSAGYPFPSGLMGFLSYDFGLTLEKISRTPKNPPDMPIPDYCFGFYDCVLMVDHYEGYLYIFSSGLPESNSSLRHRRARERLAGIVKKISDYPALHNKVQKKDASISNGHPALTSNFKKQEYLRAVKKALRYIYEGDIYQVNLAQRYCWQMGKEKLNGQAFSAYRLLRQLSPSCFSGYFDCGDFQIISSSPERFLQVRNGCVQTRPMKGTRPRGCSPVADSRYKKELLKSPKDTAELLMITDLERNDLGRVCEYGSIGVREMRTLEKYKTVFQTTSTVSGKLRKDKDCFDLLEAAFPGGSITGCPKIRAMQIIEELEPDERGIYTGAMGYLSFGQNMDFNILIRTLLVRDSKIYFHVGGGIVADSDPLKEYEETLVKASAMQSCLQQLARAS